MYLVDASPSAQLRRPVVAVKSAPAVAEPLEVAKERLTRPEAPELRVTGMLTRPADWLAEAEELEKPRVPGVEELEEDPEPLLQAESAASSVVVARERMTAERRMAQRLPKLCPKGRRP